MQTQRLDGLIAATYTPLDDNGSLNPALVAPMVEHLLQNGINGLYVCGSTGEGMSLSSDERKAVAEAYVQATDGRIPVIIQVGHNSLAEARQLAAHAPTVASARQPPDSGAVSAKAAPPAKPQPPSSSVATRSASRPGESSER